jgi:hypothetical protein
MYKLHTEHLIQERFCKDEGHKAHFIQFNQLSHPEQLNKLMDTCTKVRVKQLFTEQIAPLLNTIKFEGWSLWIDDVKCTSDPAKQILQRIHYNAMKTFLARPDHFHMSTTGFDLVDWDAIDLAMAGLPKMFRLWASKHMSHFCGVSRMQFACGFWYHS